MRSPFLDKILRVPDPAAPRKPSTMEMDEKYIGVILVAVEALIALALIAMFKQGGPTAQLLFAGFAVLSIVGTVLAARIGNRYVMMIVTVVASFLTLVLNLPNIDVPTGAPAPQFTIYGYSGAMVAVLPSYAYMIWLITRSNRLQREKLAAERAERDARRQADKASATGKARPSATGRKTASPSSRYTPPGTPSKTRHRKIEARKARQARQAPVARPDEPTPEPEPRRRPFGFGGRNKTGADQ